MILKIKSSISIYDLSSHFRIARFSDMILCLPLAFVELAKARQLSAIDESTIVDVITEVSQTSHTLLLYSLASLVNQARLSPPDLRQKQLHIINSISQVSTADPARYVPQAHLLLVRVGKA